MESDKPFESEHIIDYTDLIDEMFEKEPDGRKKEWKVWKEKLNALIKSVNQKAGYKMCREIK